VQRAIGVGATHSVRARRVGRRIAIAVESIHERAGGQAGGHSGAGGLLGHAVGVDAALVVAHALCDARCSDPRGRHDLGGVSALLGGARVADRRSIPALNKLSPLAPRPRTGRSRVDVRRGLLRRRAHAASDRFGMSRSARTSSTPASPTRRATNTPGAQRTRGRRPRSEGASPKRE
jgi:hypothetical protein